MARPTQTFALLDHFTEFEDGEHFKQKRARCNYCASSLAKKNVRRHQTHLINCVLFKQRHPEEWSAFCQYVQTLPSRESRAPATIQQQAQAQLGITQPSPASMAVGMAQQMPLPSNQSSMHPFEWQQPHQVAGSGNFTDNTFHNSRIGWGARPALLLVDVCAAYWTPGSMLDLSANPSFSGTPVSIKRLLSAARNTRIPVLWTQMSYKNCAREAGLFALKNPRLAVWEHGGEGDVDDWMPALQPLETEETVIKTHPSAFFGTTLSSRLRFAGVDTLIICGFSTSGPVRATTLDAMCENYRPMVVGTACGDRSAEIHQANINDMDSQMADVVSEDEAILHIRKGWHF